MQINLKKPKYSVLLYVIHFSFDYQHIFEKCYWVRTLTTMQKQKMLEGNLEYFMEFRQANNKYLLKVSES